MKLETNGLCSKRYTGDLKRTLLRQNTKRPPQTRWSFKVGAAVFEPWKSASLAVITKPSIHGNFKVIVCTHFTFLLLNNNKKDQLFRVVVVG